MSTHVCSRWYRPPEVCLLENMYDQATDIWGLGCCLYELMKVINEDHSPNKAILFKGKHCFPLSPQPENEEDGSRDQFAVILKKLGRMNDYDFSFIRSEDALDYSKGLNIGSDT